MKKRKINNPSHKLILFIIIIFGVLSINIAASLVFIESIASFTGIFNNTLLNSTGGYLHLNFTDSTNTIYVTNGIYTSNVLDAGFTASWDNISWFEELPGNIFSGSFDIGSFGAGSPRGITTVDDIEFWIVDDFDDLVYHAYGNGTLINTLDTTVFGSARPKGIATVDGTEFWITDSQDAEVYHIDSSGNLIDQFDTSGIGAGEPERITTVDGSEFWFVDTQDNLVYHISDSGNLINTFDLSVFGSASARGVATVDGTEFWITDITDDGIYHLNSSFEFIEFKDTTNFGSDTPEDITTVDGKEFWIVDSADDLVYHIVLPTNITFQVRSDDDNANWGDFIGPNGTTSTFYTKSSYEVLNVSNNRYFQYRVYFSTLNSSKTPKLFNVTIGYQSTGALIKPTVILDKPDDNYMNDTEQYVNITFNGTATDNSALKNATLYHNVSGTWKSNLSSSLSGTSSGFEFSLNLTNITFIWNVEACDAAGNCNFSAANRTVILNFTVSINATTLSISNFTPANNSVNVSLKQDITAIFNKDMNSSTFTDTTVIVKDTDGNNVRGKIKYFKVPRKLRFNPYRFLKENITYTINLTTGIKSEGGIGLSSDFVWNFTTEMKDTDKDGILDINDKDDDNDGINDSEDSLKGINSSHIKTDIVGLIIKVNGSINISKNFNKQESVHFFVNNSLIIEFNFSFGNKTLDLTNISIEQNENSSTGSLIINSLTLKLIKTFYLDNLSSHHGICIKDADIDSISDISNYCNETYETFLKCPGNIGNYNCTLNGTKFKITGLNHSGIKQANDNSPPRINLISVSYSGSSSVTVTLTVITNEDSSCRFDTSDQSYSSMSSLMSGSGTLHTGSRSYSQDSSRTYYVRCEDNFNNEMTSSSSISFSANVAESSSDSGRGSGSGSGSCKENWICGQWSDCKARFQTRKCTDSSNCKTEIQKPIEFQTCKKSCEDIWQCSSWSVCENSLRSRDCIDLGNCETEELKPSEIEDCEFIPECYNLIQDNDEDGIDCGGPCPACETCYDRIQNQNEDGIDCGDPCRPCRSGDIISGNIVVMPEYKPDPTAIISFLLVVVASVLFFKYIIKAKIPFNLKFKKRGKK